MTLPIALRGSASSTRKRRGMQCYSSILPEMPNLQAIAHIGPIHRYILLYEVSRFAIICRMATAAFDTLQAARKLQRAGFDQPKAEALVELMRQRDSDLATKADIARLEGTTNRLEGSINQLEGSINQLRNWFVSGLITILVAILATAFLPG